MVINISLDDLNCVYRDSQKQFSLVAIIDEIACNFRTTK